jgi:hypothetical protein
MYFKQKYILKIKNQFDVIPILCYTISIKEKSYLVGKQNSFIDIIYQSNLLYHSFIKKSRIKE